MSNFKLSTRFNLFLLGVFIAGTLVGGFILWRALYNAVQFHVSTTGLTLMETIHSVRHYTSNNIAPLLEEDMDEHPEFIAETVPAFAAREIFEDFRQQNKQYEAFFYKEATLNPTNLRDLADDFEATLVDRMRSDVMLQQLSGFRSKDNTHLFYIARPLSVDSPTCLRCHSDPAVAPRNMIAAYGSENGFGWELNEIIAVQIIYVPAEDIFDLVLATFLKFMGIFVGIFAVVILLINVLLKRYVIEPVATMGQVAQKISTDEWEIADLDSKSLLRAKQRSDELSTLATVFCSMAREVYNRTQRLKQQVNELRIEIDEYKRREQVAEIVETDYFQDLQSKVNALRQRSRRKQAGDTEPDVTVE